MNPMETLSRIAHRLPAHVLQDIDKRISDWLASGGRETDPYIHQQLCYAENWLTHQKKEETKCEK